ncbi:nicotinate-nucleotide--dimethylbenzimidazole phosphoribosyltransferase [Streptomyces sp. NPDC057540]|uniref:nicotinate-nucleotide--dimethylbenzimidazole phosphoribosyltransferase n=1 Tax=Streptomyces sp. NPDC057540 TaxID=3346160 RepID=UPI0036919497
MTDTGQVPGEGLPENAGMVEQPGIPAPGAYTFLDPSEHTADDDDILLMPGAQGAWSEHPPGFVPAPPVAVPAPHVVSGQGLPHVAVTEAPAPMGDPLTDPLPDPLTGPLPDGVALADVLTAPQGAQLGTPAHGVPVPPQEPVPTEHGYEPGILDTGAHEAAGRDTGSVDLGGVRMPPPATAPTPPPARRPLHMGPQVPDASGGVVLSLADRGPAAAHAPAPQPAPVPEPVVATAPAPVPVRNPGPPTTGPEYFEIAQDQQLASPQGAEPWVAQPQEPAAPQAPAETVVPGTARFVQVEGSVPTTPHLAPVPAPEASQAAVEPSEAPAAVETAPEAPEEPVAPEAQVMVPAPREAEPAVPVQEAAPQAAEPAAEVPAEPAPAVEPAQEPAPVQQPEAEATEAAPAETVPEPVQVAAEELTEPAPAEALVEAPAEVPAEAPAQPQAEEPVETPAETVAEEIPAEALTAPETEQEAAPEQEAQPVAQAPAAAHPEPTPEAQAADVQTPEAQALDAVAADVPAPGTEASEAETPAEALVVAEATPVADPAPVDETVPDAAAVEAPAPDNQGAVEPTADVVPDADQAQAADVAPEADPAQAVDVAPEADPAQPADQAQAADSAPAPGYDDAEREAVLRVMRERRDIRNGFRNDPIPHEVLLRVLEAAHTAPSVGHSQPWDFVVIRSAETRQTMHELAQRQREAYAKSLPKARAKQFKELKIEAILDTPVNIVVTADPTRGGRHTLGRYTQPQMAPYSSALAVENLWLAARAEGLGVGWVSFFDEREMVRTLGLPEHLEVVAYLCVGYVDEFPDEPELMQAGWSKRRPLAWVVHEETYGRRALPGEEPHDLLQETVANIRPLDAKALGEAWERQKRMTKPAGALGMLEIISAQLSGLSRMCPPPIPEPAAVAIFAGDHGVHAQGVTPWPQEVTGQMVANFLGGGAVCNAFANQVGAEVCVIDVGVASELPATPGLLPRKVRPGTGDFTTGPAMTREEVLAAIEVGIETARDLVAAGNKALLTGEMGIANTTASAALISVYTGVDPAEVTGRGTGINDETHARKVDVVRRALDLHKPDPADPIGVLSAVGGLEHAALVGLVLGAASLRTPVILDGVSTGAAALVARAIAPESLAACIAGHRSAEPGHVAALNKLGLRPLVDLDLRLGEGTGALLALPLVQSAARAMHEVATFDSAGVTEK